MSITWRTIQRVLLITGVGVALVLFGVLGSGAQTVHAQINTDLTEFQEATQLGDADLRVTIAKIVRVVLGFLGILAVLIVLWAGFLWMTAAGNEDQVGRAKRILIQGLIGLLIIMSALAITQFVLKEFGEATGTTFTSSGGGSSGSSGGALGSGGSKTFSVTSITPTGAIPNYDVTVHILFSQTPQIASVNENVTLRKSGETTPVPVNIVILDKHVLLSAKEECGGENVPSGKTGCLNKNTKYVVEIGSGKTGVKSKEGSKQLKCGLGSSCSATFTTGDQLDNSVPNIDITTPDSGAQVPQASSVPIEAIVGDTLGVAMTVFTVDGEVVEVVPVGLSEKLPKIVGTNAWDTSNLSLGSTHTITATAYDFGGNKTKSQPITVKVAPAHCFDGEQTEGTDEIGVDCSPSNGACGLCGGGQCATDADCSSGACVETESGALQCVNVPLIEHASPDSGGSGKWVTITGKYFGDTGSVSLLDATGETVQKIDAPQAQCGGSSTWTDTAIVVEIPDGLTAGATYPIEVANSLGNDVTNNDRGAYLPNAFTVTDQDDSDTPGLCAVVPSAEKPGNSVTFFGKQLPIGIGDQTLRFGGQTAIITDAASATTFSAIVPQVSVGTFLADLEVSGEKTNPVLFTVLGDADTPSPAITALSSDGGPPSQYLTITGTNFGDFQNLVRFTKLTDDLVPTDQSALGTFDFPAQCDVLGTWKDTSITVKVPETAIGKYHVQVIRNDADNNPDNDVSNVAFFKITDTAPTPGLCAVVPDNGPEGTPVALHGEGFGAAPGAVTFFDAVQDVPSGGDWEATRIDTEVPDKAQTGPVIVVASDEQLQSNGVPFAVQSCTKDESICGPNAQCCSSGSCIPLTDGSGNPLSCDTFGAPEASYTFSFFTGKAVPDPNDFPPVVIEECSAGSLPSPTPWEGHGGGTSVCTDAAALGVRFSIPLAQESLTVNQGIEGAFQLHQCIGDNPESCTVFSDAQVPLELLSYVDVAGGQDPADVEITAQQSYVTLLPKQSFAPGAWYMMVLTDKITGLHKGLSLVGNTSCGGTPAEGSGVYCYQFKTAEVGSSCTLGSAQVTPVEFTVTDPSQLVSGSGAIKNLNSEDEDTALLWQVFGTASESECLLVNTCSAAFDWTWESDSPDVVLPKNIAGQSQCVQSMHVVGEGAKTVGISGGVQSVPAFVSATESSGVSGSTEILVDYGAPRVLEQCGGLVQSPTPWSKRTGGDNACINAVVNVVFSHKMDNQTFTKDAVYVQECVGSEEGAAACESVGEPLLTVPTVFSADTESEQRDGAQIRLVNSTNGAVPVHVNWKPDTWYRVAFSTAITSVDGVAMEPNPGCASEEAYCFTFKTQNSTEICAVADVEVSPAFYTAQNFGLVMDVEGDQLVPAEFTATPLAEDQCIVLEGNNLQWDWSVENGNSSKALQVYDGNGPVQSLTGVGATQNIWAKHETTEGDPSFLHASNSNKTGSSQVAVDLVAPSVGLSGPTCATACVNAQIFVEFDQKINITSLVQDFDVDGHDKIVVAPCTNESCLLAVEADGFVSDQVENSGVALTIDQSVGVSENLNIVHESLAPDTWYRVFVRIGDGGLVNEVGIPVPVSAFAEEELYPADNPQYYSWTFRTKKDGALCGIDNAQLQPQESVVPGAGIIVSYQVEAFGSPDNCSPSTGQLLQASSYDWSWNIDDSTLASFVGGTPVDTVDVSNSPVCTASCLGKGSAVYGTVVCGDGVIGAGESCDDGNISSGDGCSSTCLLEGALPVTQGGTCGDGVVQNAEACDGTPGCSANCTLLGSASPFAECGNGDVGEGEECDGGIGCSSSCLFAGTSPAYAACQSIKEVNASVSCVGVRVCGNGEIEPGEDAFCESAIANAGGLLVDVCTNTCQLVGGSQKASPTDEIYCGNGTIEPYDGEQCDDGNQVNGDGCSTACLLEGSSAAYVSFCGNGEVETGELASCEQAAGSLAFSGDGNVDSTQYVVGIEGSSVPVIDNKQSTDITATAAGVTAQGSFALQCGFTHDTQCQPGMAVGIDSCCHVRPMVMEKTMLPLSGSQNLCKNIGLSVEFDQVIDPSSINDASVRIVTTLANADACTAQGGTVVQLHESHPDDPWYRRAWFAVANTVRGWVGVTPLYAAVDCDGLVDRTVQLTTIQKEIKGALVDVSALTVTPQTVFEVGEYTVILSQNITNTFGAGLANDVQWNFGIGNDICAIDRVSVHPVEHIFFANGEEAAQTFYAQAETELGETYQPITPSTNYDWDWDWKVIDEEHAQILGGEEAAQQLKVTVAPTGQKGSTALRARATITTNTLFEDNSSNSVSGFANLFSVACENPWPHGGVPNIHQYSQGSLSFPFEDTVTDPQTNIATWYCRGDNGSALLPSFTIQNASIPDQDSNDAMGLLKSLFFRNPENGDAIGLRVHKNADYLSPQDWYAAQGFIGNPDQIEIAGYQALQEGTTIYISAANVIGKDFNYNAPRFANMYVISHNDSANDVTKNIYNQIIQNLTFNTNIDHKWNQGICVGGAVLNTSQTVDPDTTFLEAAGAPLDVTCSSVIDCAENPDLVKAATVFGSQRFGCSSITQQLQRDLVRLGDLQSLRSSVDAYAIQTGNPPTLPAGTFLSGLAVSTWDSWDATLGQTLGTPVPKDPVNQHYTTHDAWVTLQNSGETVAPDLLLSSGCEAQGGDSETCWNAGLSVYQCVAGSHVYQYQAQLGDEQAYQLHASLEVGSAAQWSGNPLTTGEVPFSFNSMCAAQEFAPGDVCGDGVLSPQEQCEVGMLVGGGDIEDPKSCVVTDADGNEYPGHYVYECPNSCQFYSDPLANGAACEPFGSCGDGVINGDEVCDDGALNGTYNNCAADCTAPFSVAGSCGDGVVQAAFGEVCDPGSTVEMCHHLTAGQSGTGEQATVCKQVEKNAEYDAVAAAFTITGDSGSKHGQTPCIADTESALGGHCAFTSIECNPAGGTACPWGYLGQEFSGGSTVYNADKALSCNWDCQVSGPYCGDGVVNGFGDQVEECDTQSIDLEQSCVTPDGKQGTRKQHCTSSCLAQPAVCEAAETGSSAAVPSTPAFCGDGIFQADNGEECDAGASNGSVCVALYGSSCDYCSNTCKTITISGGLCGDGVRQANEECDTDDHGGAQCSTFGFAGGTLSCLNDCTLNKTQCTQ